MNRIISLLIILLGCIIGYNASSQTMAKRYIKYTERLNTEVTSFQNQDLPVKSNRVSSRRGNINMFYDETLPDSVKIAINTAKSLWESKIQNKYNINLGIEFIPLDDNVAMEVEVGNFKIAGSDLYYPSALVYQLLDFDGASDESMDGYIFLNEDIEWTCNFSQETVSTHNLPTVILRGIARCLGFGTSVIDGWGESLGYLEFNPTVFDNMLFSKGVSLANYIHDGKKLKELATSDNVWFHTESDSLKIFAPSEFISNESLCYFDDDSSLMSHSLAEGNISLAIDNKTIDVLNTIGWESLLGEPEIKCADISDDGIGSSYASHTFTLINDNSNISSYDWKFFLKNRQGDYELISTGSTSDFTIEGINSQDSYFVNINGDLEGMIQCDYTVNGIEFSARPFSVSLELKPIIISIDDLTVVTTGRYAFAVQCNVQYSGADYVTVKVEEDYDSYVRNYRFREPYFAHVITGNITTLDYSWVTFEVSNKYGKASKTIEFEPKYGSNANASDNSGIIINNDIITNVCYDYTINDDSFYKCEGTIVLDVDIPKDATYIEFQRGRLSQNIHLSNLFFSSRCAYPVNSEVISQEGLHNDEFFRMVVLYSDNHREYSPTLYTNDLISPEDLERINGHSSLDSQTLDDVKIFKTKNKLIVYTTETINLVVSDLLGSQLFSGEVSHKMELPLENWTSPIIIVNYSTLNESKTLKIINK